MPPLQRTRESAEIVAARLDLPIEFRDDLIELDFGEGPARPSIDPRRPRWHPGGRSAASRESRRREHAPSAAAESSRR